METGPSAISILYSLTAYGFIPKELPPFVSSLSLAKYIRSNPALLKIARNHRQPTLASTITLPKKDLHRSLAICNPISYLPLCEIIANNFSTLSEKCCSQHNLSRFKLDPKSERAITTRFKPGNVARERHLGRWRFSHLVQTDISDFYPSVYTHAIGWSVDEELRDPSVYQNSKRRGKLLGHLLDKGSMNLNKRFSQGIPIGPDTSLVLAEVLLSAVDTALEDKGVNFTRWYDDYELYAHSESEARAACAFLSSQLSSFGLRLNPLKTRVLTLPLIPHDSWQLEIRRAAKELRFSWREVQDYIDLVIRHKSLNPDENVISYALTCLFSVNVPTASEIHYCTIALFELLQLEETAARKYFGLCSYWGIRGVEVKAPDIADICEALIVGKDPHLLGIDALWALDYCRCWKVQLSKKVYHTLRDSNSCPILLSCLDSEVDERVKSMMSERVSDLVNVKDPLSGSNWLLAYESYSRQWSELGDNAVVPDFYKILLDANVNFVRRDLSKIKSLFSYGIAPRWLAKELAVRVPSNIEVREKRALRSVCMKLDLARNDASMDGESFWSEANTASRGGRQPNQETESEIDTRY